MRSNGDYGVEVDGGAVLLRARGRFVTCRHLERRREGGAPELVDALCFDVETGRAQALAGDGFESCAGFGGGSEIAIGSFLEEFLEIDDLLGLREAMSVPLRTQLENLAAKTGLDADAGYQYPLLPCAVHANRFRGYPSEFFRVCSLLGTGCADRAAGRLPLNYHDVARFYDSLGLGGGKRVREKVVANPWPLLIRECGLFLGASSNEVRQLGAARSLDEDEMLDLLRDSEDDPSWFRGFVQRWSRARRLLRTRASR